MNDYEILDESLKNNNRWAAHVKYRAILYPRAFKIGTAVTLMLYIVSFICLVVKHTSFVARYEFVVFFLFLCVSGNRNIESKAKKLKPKKLTD